MPVVPEALLEDDGFVVVDQDTAFEVPSQGLSQHALFEIASAPRQFAHRVAVVYPADVLVNDRAFIEVGRCVVCGRADEFYPACVGLVIGSATGECGEEGVVNVDDRYSEPVQQIGRKDLHVAREDDEIDVVFPAEADLLGLGVGPLFCAGGSDGYMVKGDPVVLRRFAESGVIGHDAGNLPVKLARLCPEENIVEAMGDLGDEERDPGDDIGPSDSNGHPQFARGKLSESLTLLAALFGAGSARGDPFHPLKENPFLGILMLIGVEDVSSTRENPAGYLGDNAGLVRAGEEGDEPRFAH